MANNNQGWVIAGTVEPEGGLRDWWRSNHGPMNDEDRQEMEREVGTDPILQRVVLAHALNGQRGEIPVFLFRSSRTVRVFQWSLDHAQTRQKIGIYIYKQEEDGTLNSLRWGRRQIFEADKPQNLPTPVRQLLLTGEWPFENDDEGEEENQVYAETFRRPQRISSPVDDTDRYELRQRENPLPPPIMFDPNDTTYKIDSPTDSDRSSRTESTMSTTSTTLSSNNDDAGGADAPWDLIAMFQPFLLSTYRTLKKSYPKRLYHETARAILSLLSSWQDGTWEDYQKSNIHALLKDRVPILSRASERVENILLPLEKARLAREADQGNVSDQEDDEGVLEANDLFGEVYELLYSRFGIDTGDVRRMMQFFDRWIADVASQPVETAYDQNEQIRMLLERERLNKPYKIAKYFAENVVPYIEQEYGQFVVRSVDTSVEEREKLYTGKMKYTADDPILKRSKELKKKMGGRIPAQKLIGGTEDAPATSVDRDLLRKELNIRDDLERLYGFLTPAQLKVVRNVSNSHGQLVVAHTGFGKTVCIILIAALFLLRKKKVIIAVKRTTYQQFERTIEQYFSGPFMEELLQTLVTHYEFYQGNGLDNVDLVSVARDVDAGTARAANASQVEMEQANELDEKQFEEQNGDRKGKKGKGKSTSRNIRDNRGAIVLLDECHLYAIDYFRIQNSRYSSMNTYKVMLQCAVAERVYLFSATPCRTSGKDLLSLLCMVKRIAPTPRQFNMMSPLLNYTPGEPRILPLPNGEDPINANWKCLVTSIRPGSNDSGFATLKTSNRRVRMDQEEEDNYRKIERDGVFNEKTKQLEVAWSSFGRLLRQACYTNTKLQQAMRIIYDHLETFRTARYMELRDKIKPRVLIYSESIDYAQVILGTLRHNFKRDSKHQLAVYIPAGQFNDKNPDYRSFQDVLGPAQICIVTEAGITGYDAPALTCIIAMNSFWSPSSSSQLEGRLVRRNRHEIFFENNLPTVFRMYTLQAVLTDRLDLGLQKEIANITEADDLEVTDRDRRNYTFDERQQVVMLKKAGWIRAAMDRLHEVANADEKSAECLTDEEQERCIQKRIVTTRTKFFPTGLLSSLTPSGRVVPARPFKVPVPVTDSAPQWSPVRPSSAPSITLSTPPRTGPTIIHLTEGQDTVINPLTNRPLKVGSATYRKLIKDKIIEIA